MFSARFTALLLFSYRPDAHGGHIKPTYWVVICREKGSLEIYTVPDFRLVFVCPNLSNAPKLLIDSGAPNPQNARFVIFYLRLNLSLDEKIQRN